MAWNLTEDSLTDMVGQKLNSAPWPNYQRRADALVHNLDFSIDNAKQRLNNETAVRRTIFTVVEDLAQIGELVNVLNVGIGNTLPYLHTRDAGWKLLWPLQLKYDDIGHNATRTLTGDPDESDIRSRWAPLIKNTYDRMFRYALLTQTYGNDTLHALAGLAVMYSLVKRTEELFPRIQRIYLRFVRLNSADFDVHELNLTRRSVRPRNVN